MTSHQEQTLLTAASLDGAAQHPARNAARWGFVLMAVAYALMYWWRPGGAERLRDFSNIYQAVAAGLAAWCAFGCAKQLAAPREPGLRTSACWVWWLIGLACLSDCLAEAAWTFYETWRNVEPPYPGWPDVFYLMSYPLLIAGTVPLFAGVKTMGRARLLLDSALISLSFGVLIWTFAIAPLWQHQDISLLEKCVGAAYPLMDVALFFCACALLWSNRGQRRTGLLLAGGMALWGVADICYLFDSADGIYASGNWYDAGWGWGYLLIGLSAWEQWCDARLPALAMPAPTMPVPQVELQDKPEAQSNTLWRVMAPYFVVGGAFVLIGARQWRDKGDIGADLMVSGGAILLLVLVRQFFTLLENVSLTRELSRFNHGLEDTVARRTRQMDALLQLTKAVNNTLLEDSVLARAADGTRSALEADAVALWLHPDANATALAVLSIHRGLEARPDIVQSLAAIESGARRRETIPGGTSSGGTLLLEPIMWRGESLGVLGALRWNGDFEEEEARLLESIGLEVGAALQNARMYSAAVDAADRDGVTGLLNHRAVQGRYEAAFTRAVAEKRELAVIMMDLNNFKLFNDTYGHPVGDQVLKQVARVLSEERRVEDIVGRYGGDEFLIVLPGAGADSALCVAERIRDLMDEEGFRPPGQDDVLPITLSFGVAAFPQDSRSRHELLTTADANLYEAKDGRKKIRGTSDIKRDRSKLRAGDVFSALDAIVTAVDNKDSYTRRHSEDVTQYALWMADELGWGEDTKKVIRVGGMLHDAGKICVPVDILRKPGALTNEEFAVMKQHPWIGALIAGTMPGMEQVVPLVRSHHERWDGTGYPDGLKGNDIPLLGRLLAVADAVSAMTTHRPYRKAMAWETALQIVRDCAGTQFDPQMADAFLNAVAKRGLGPTSAADADADAALPAPDSIASPAFRELAAPSLSG